VRQRINDAGGFLTVWAELNEDVYEPQLATGFTCTRTASR
jgi:hypothetical protein